MSTITFAKMHGCGNDFMVIDAINQAIDLNSELIRKWSNRYTGIGFDQLLLIEKSTKKETLFKYRIFNADGEEVEQCGNGARCFALFVYRHGLSLEERYWVETKNGLIQLLRHADSQVTVDMGKPQFAPKLIPCTLPEEQLEYEFDAFKETLKFSAISMGNPHCTLFLDKIEQVDLALIAENIKSTNYFPQGVNVGVIEILSKDKIKLRVFERGSGETLACGSGACAAVVAGIRLGKLAETVEVCLPGGELIVSWGGSGHTVKMTGPASYVYEGKIRL